MANSLSRRKQTHQFKEPSNANSYRSQTKIRGTPRCPNCGAVSVRGRWLSPKQFETRKPVMLVTGEQECPACRQLDDHFALGVIELHGEEWKKMDAPIGNMIRNTEKIARSRNDQERVLWTHKSRNVTKVYVTLPELARRIGRQLEKSFQGVVEYDRSTDEPYLRVRWWSDLPHLSHRGGARFPMKAKAKTSATTSRSKSLRGRGA